MADMHDLLRYLADMGGSDLYLKAGAIPHVRIDGHLQAGPFDPLDATATERLAREIVPPQRTEEFSASGETDFAYGVTNVGRFRVHAYRQRGSVALVIRRVLPGIPAWASLGLPPAVERLAEETKGLVIVSGPAGSGKTTTANALLDHVNDTRPAHIVTIEDPIEYLHSDKRSIVSQREVGTDVADVATALRRIMRQGPDVVFLGELGDAVTAQLTLDAAETGHLVVATMVTTSAAETVNRLLDLFPAHQERQVRQAVAGALRAVVSQRLLERADGKGRVPAVEVLVNTNKAADAILEPDRHPPLDKIIAEGEYYGMQTFDQSLFTLCKEGLVSLRDALAVANEPEELRISLQHAGLSPAF